MRTIICVNDVTGDSSLCKTMKCFTVSIVKGFRKFTINVFYKVLSNFI